ncbi:MAG TPA: BglII/BstYI family type II restriction endonuclease [Usitatibacteraceae bacterium]|uniref:BglII/BstYI family type II restriction endonuclease n=1 Tax=Immundisolibacter sp. TaxID=1934948 RepID=UPI002E6279B5|nr:BglII/BstYI family type II restriction endonuclease [Usitatibacteraceae bacterium]
MFEQLKNKGFQVLALHHAEAILRHDMPEAVAELEEALSGIEIPVEELVRGGGGEGAMTQRLRRALADTHGWRRHNFVIRKIVDGVEKESTSHEIDHVKRFAGGTFALEIEWNNKDPFFDRDLENFKRLHADGVISVGAIVTRGESLHNALRDLVAAFARQAGIRDLTAASRFYAPTQRQIGLIEQAAKARNSFEDGWAHAFVSDKFGEATTHWRKLEDRVRRGVGNPCPLLLIGIPAQVVTVHSGE